MRGYEDWADGVRSGENIVLWDFAGHERYLDLAVDDPRREEFSNRRVFEAVPFRYGEMCAALTKFDRTDDGREALWSEELTRNHDEGPRGIVPYCKWVAEKYGKAKLCFDGFKTRVQSFIGAFSPRSWSERFHW